MTSSRGAPNGTNRHYANPGYDKTPGIPGVLFCSRSGA